MLKTINTYFFFLVLINNFSDAQPSQEIIRIKQNPLKVVDGDTIHIGKTKYRLHGIDAPEVQQKCERLNKIYSCGKEAKEYLRSLIKSKERVKCQKKAVDKYKRTIAVCYYNKENLNKLMVRNGWAIAYRKYSKDYVDDEYYAKENKLGMWEGFFVNPYEWRKKNR